MVRIAFLLLTTAIVAGCALRQVDVAALPGSPGNPERMVSGQTPAGVYGSSAPDVYYQPENSFPRGAATVEGRHM